MILHTYLYIIHIQLRSCTQHADDHDNESSRLESQPTCNGGVHDSNLNEESNGKLQGQKSNGDLEDQPCWCPDLQYIIIDMAPVTFIDSCGSKMLERVSVCVCATNGLWPCYKLL